MSDASLLQTRSVSYSEVAAVTVLTWDILTSISDEVEHIWSKRWTPAKVMYLISRYLPWMFQLALLAININGSTGLQFTMEQCRKWMTMQAVILQIIVTTVDVILIIRVYALYNRSHVLLACLMIACVAEIAVLCYVLAIVTPELGFNRECFVISSPHFFVVYWITSLIFETVLFVLTLAKFLSALHQGWGSGQLVQQFTRDGTWAYTVIFATMLVNAMLYDFMHSPLAGICFTWLLTVLSCAGCRLILLPRTRSANEVDGTVVVHDIELDQLPPSPLSLRSPVYFTRMSFKSSIEAIHLDGLHPGISGSHEGAFAGSHPSTQSLPKHHAAYP
ncbi:hypothetical protein CERSUDRAFT_118479 [Gelatoporia subvermispora B]|uniref:DUF6533 domain-containing protein n=1 Tax=Ceriporiopsis subvermispora (strain B) TaxID=914234 RepID=M2R1H9_CERS8|nr:hypothetical protein CERSUDRAFT_118479 [Gelatoporia subvermispora B]